jgi:hypothetical protein
MAPTITAGCIARVLIMLFIDDSGHVSCGNQLDTVFADEVTFWFFALLVAFFTCCIALALFWSFVFFTFFPFCPFFTFFPFFCWFFPFCWLFWFWAFNWLTAFFSLWAFDWFAMGVTDFELDAAVLVVDAAPAGGTVCALMAI